jgi:hypothetical protein
MNNDCAMTGPTTSIHPPNEQTPRSREPGGLLSHHPIHTGVGGFVRLPGPANSYRAQGDGSAHDVKPLPGLNQIRITANDIFVLVVDLLPVVISA